MLFIKEKKKGEYRKPRLLDYSNRSGNAETLTVQKHSITFDITWMKSITSLTRPKNPHRSTSNPSNPLHRQSNPGSVKKTSRTGFSNPSNLLHTRTHEERGKV